MKRRAKHIILVLLAGVVLLLIAAGGFVAVYSGGLGKAGAPRADPLGLQSIL